jgi:hypothetical protein
LLMTLLILPTPALNSFFGTNKNLSFNHHFKNIRLF